MRSGLVVLAVSIPVASASRYGCNWALGGSSSDIVRKSRTDLSCSCKITSRATFASMTDSGERGWER